MSRAHPMIGRACLLLGLGLLSGPLAAEPTDPCAGQEGTALTQCINSQQTQRQQRLEQLLQQQEERQAQLDRQQREFQQQQREVQQQLDAMREQNESLRRELAREAAAPPPTRVVTVLAPAAGPANPAASQEIRTWKAENPWFGSDYAKTQFAMRYTKELELQRPELTGRELLDEVAKKVNETFGAKR